MRHGNGALNFAGADVRVDQYLMIMMAFLIIAASHNNLFISPKSSCPQPFQTQTSYQNQPHYLSLDFRPFLRAAEQNWEQLCG